MAEIEDVVRVTMWLDGRTIRFGMQYPGQSMFTVATVGDAQSLIQDHDTDHANFYALKAGTKLTVTLVDGNLVLAAQAAAPPTTPAQDHYAPFASNGDLVYRRIYGTTAQRPVDVPNGWIYFDTDFGLQVYNDGGAWSFLSVATTLSAGTAHGLTCADTTALTMGTPATGTLLMRSGTSIIGVAESSLSVSTAVTCSGNAATATLAATASACSGNSATATTAAACSGNAATATTAGTCSGNSATATLATSASGLKFNATVIANSSTAPTTGMALVYDGTNIVGATRTPACTPAVASNSSSTSITFTIDRRYTWTGSGATSLTASLTGAVDGTTVTIYFPANQITTLAIDTTLAPTAAYAVSNFNAAAKYVLVMTYYTTGIVTTGYLVT